MGCSKGRKTHGGSFSNELDAANSVNQLCKKLGIPEKNPGIGTIPPRQWQNFDIQTVGSEEANSVMDSEIIKTKNREKIKNSLKNFIIDEKSSFKKCYFYNKISNNFNPRNFPTTTTRVSARKKKLKQ